MANIDWYKIVDIIQRYKTAVRIKWTGVCDDPEWGCWVIIPTDGYIETGDIGPVPFREVEWLEIDTSRINVNGRLAPNLDAEATTHQMGTKCDHFVFDGTRARINKTQTD